MGIKADAEIDYAKSTNAYPMDKEPQPLFVDNSDIDYSKSTGAYPMYDEHVTVVPHEETGGVAIERVVEHVGSETAEVRFSTPGPTSSGPEELVTAQRAEMGLSADPTGESDAGYEARPSSIAVPGADGVDRDANQAGEDAAVSMSASSDAKDNGEAGTKAVKSAKTKVVKPPAQPVTEGTSTAQGK
jgi:hypothetical protein